MEILWEKVDFGQFSNTLDIVYLSSIPYNWNAAVGSALLNFYCFVV